MSNWNQIQFTPEQISRGAELRQAGYSWRRVAAALVCSEESIRRRLDPAYAELRNRRFDHPTVKTEPGRIGPREALAVLARIPVDTRGRMARFMGDPIPGRSALDMRQARVPTPSPMIASYPR